MPSPVSTSLLVFAAILTTLSPLAAVIVAGVAVLFEVGLFVYAGVNRAVANAIDPVPRDGVG